MPSLRIKKDIGFNDVEYIAQRLLLGDVDEVFFPNSLKNTGLLGIEGFLIQCLVGWYRNTDKCSARIYVNDDLKEEYFQSLYLQVAAIMSDRIFNVKGGAVDRDQVNLFLKNKMDSLRRLDFKRAYKGPYLSIASLRSEYSDFDFQNPFYSSENIAGGEDFREICSRAIEKALLGVKGRMEKIGQERISNISNIVYELFSNTHRHARSDVHGDFIQRNVRGVIFNGNMISKKRMLDVSENNSFKLKNLADDWFSKNSSNSMYALEITVIDGGPGYARRWLGKEKDKIERDEEFLAVIECFKKHNSSSAYASSGSGLTTVLRSLRNLHGWLRLRTGSIVLEKSFANGEGELNIKEKDMAVSGEFLDGTVFSVVVPLR